jgi:hypothetical protein
LQLLAIGNLWRRRFTAFAVTPMRFRRDHLDMIKALRGGRRDDPRRKPISRPTMPIWRC